MKIRRLPPPKSTSPTKIESLSSPSWDLETMQLCAITSFTIFISLAAPFALASGGFSGFNLFTKLAWSSNRIEEDKFKFSFRTLWAFAGPGWLMSIAYIDPGNIESDLQAGAFAGYSLIWMLFYATCAGFLLQMLAARLGVVTGKSLAEICREEYPIVPRLIVWLMTEIAIIGSDIQEVVGSAIAINLLSSGYIPLWGGVIITAADTFTFLLLERRGIRRLEVLFVSLIGIMLVTFGIEFVMSKPNFLEIAKGLGIPSVPKGAEVQTLGILGAVIMPYNIYLHSALVQSRKIDRSRRSKIQEAVIYNAIESGLALFVSFVVNAFIVAVFAASFYPVSSADDIGLHNAGERLGEVYGKFAVYIWAIGLLAAGQSSTMTGTYAGQFVMSGFLKLDIAPWKRVMITRSVAIVPSSLVAILAQKGLDVLDEWLNVLQSVQLPFALIPVLVFTSSERIMGTFKNHIVISIIVWLLAGFAMATNIFLIYEFTQTSMSDSLQNPYFYAFLISFGAIYTLFLCYLIVTPQRVQRIFQRCGCCKNRPDYQTIQ